MKRGSERRIRAHFGSHVVRCTRQETAPERTLANTHPNGRNRPTPVMNDWQYSRKKYPSVWPPEDNRIEVARKWSSHDGTSRIPLRNQTTGQYVRTRRTISGVVSDAREMSLACCFDFALPHRCFASSIRPQLIAQKTSKLGRLASRLIDLISK